ncbi:nitroreductase family protein [Gordonia neofelifaecis]|uniref:Nitroreductase n=1 Tax=Gordonia neofelifaecis NRRL B-59395 TaxID=644548 RepID=F1YNY6_9ACTN|nr:nitroreductase family protein [Gordonia neofelifaecis]EGD53605.1 nitroreductase [Gordonia neofelifaecis NRRL B-59395]
MQFDDVIRTTFAAREFTADPVPDDVLGEIFETARFAPSGGNRQGAHVIVVRDPESKARLAELSKPAARRYLAQRCAGENPWNPVHPTAVTEADLAETRGVDGFVAPIAVAPVVLVVTVDLAVVATTDSELDRVGIVGGASVYPLVWNILTAARSHGFGGTITTMISAEEEGVRELLGVPATHAVAAAIPLGRPVKQLTRLRRVPVADFVTRERFDGASFGADERSRG